MNDFRDRHGYANPPLEQAEEAGPAPETLMLFSLARDEEDRFDLKGHTRPRAVASLEGVGFALSITTACARERY